MEHSSKDTYVKKKKDMNFQSVDSKQSVVWELNKNREKHPKLATMLFIGHSAATAINAEKVYFTQNPILMFYRINQAVPDAGCFLVYILFHVYSGRQGKPSEKSGRKKLIPLEHDKNTRLQT